MAFGTVVLAVGGGTAINVAHAVKASDDISDVWTPAIAGAVMAVTLSFVNEASPEIASMLALLFLMGTFLLRGTWFAEQLAKLVGPSK